MHLRHLSIAALLLASPLAHALQRITLRNGFTYDCLRAEPIDSAHIRLVLDARGNSLDLAADAIATVETLPDPAPEPAAKAALTAATEDQPSVRSFLSRAGEQHHIDVDLLASIANAESAGNTRATSRKGAQGLMQLMPSTARAMGVANVYEPEGNINGGTAYLDALLTRYKDNLALALAAYNAGPGAVDRYHGIPPFRETQAYVVRVMTEFKHRKEAIQLAKH